MGIDFMSIIIFDLYTQVFGLKPYEHFLNKTCTDFAHTFGHTGKSPPELLPEYICPECCSSSESPICCV